MKSRGSEVVQDTVLASKPHFFHHIIKTRCIFDESCVAKHRTLKEEGSFLMVELRLILNCDETVYIASTRLFSAIFDPWSDYDKQTSF